VTELLFLDNAYAKSADATVVGVNDRGGIILDRTIFYATSGGQPGDKGALTLSDGRTLEIATTVYDSDKTTPVHVRAEATETGGAGLNVGDKITMTLDWSRRYDLMRTHTALHLLCSLIDFPVTGGQINVAKGRLDFAIPEPKLDKVELSERLQELIDGDHAISTHWITEAELDEKPEMVRTMSVKPPRGSGRIRLVDIADVDLQPCGGTHVAATGELISAAVTKIENKGAQNRRVRIELAAL